MRSSYQPIIGLEVHVEFDTERKMFCRCPNNHFQVEPNTNTCPVCLGLPGALPVPNQKAIEYTIQLASAFNCQINKNFHFDRKNYFYPDLPKGYQISQHFNPIAVKGEVPILADGKMKNIGLNDIHLEEDTGKLVHAHGETLVDYNRSGVPLVEIVSAPDIHSAKEAKIYLKRLQQTIRWLGLSDCDMEKGSMRLEANISIAQQENQLPDYRVEVKNLNSFRFAEKAIAYEINRQTKLVKQGKQPPQETRGWNDEKGKTYVQRSKETAKDYRYFPEPDIPPFEFTGQQVQEIENKIDTLPWQEEQKIIDAGVRWKWAEIISRDKHSLELFWGTVDQDLNPKDVANHIVNNPLPDKITPKKLAKKIKANQNQFDMGKEEIESAVKEVIKQNPQAIEDYKAGKQAAIGFLIGQVMQKTKGKADPKLTRKLLLEQLEKD
jgi:aspartyl-tRNA(Asn)/glutamyl-tRNA(Gln) amidotransferase subunit B